jgi:phage-related protein
MNNRGVFNDLEDAIEGLAGPLGKLITALINGLVPILPPLIGLASSLAGTLQGVLIAAVRALVPLLVPLVGILAELLQKAILPLLPFVEKLANMLAGFLVKAVQALLPAVAKLAMALLEILVALTPLLPPIMQLATTLLSLALKVITPLVPLITTLAGILAGLASVIATVIGWIAKIVAVALTWITNFGKVGHAIATLFDWIKGHWPLLLLILTGPIGAAIAIILALFPNLLKGVENVARDVASWFGKLPHMILEALGDLGSLLFGSGEKIIQGLINGIGSMIGDVEHAVSSVVDDIKSFLPFSPAKKGPLSGSGAPDVSGRQIAAMLAQGMTSGAGPVQAAAAGLARAAGIGPGSSGAGAGGAGTAGNPGQVTIQLQAGGSSGLDQLFMQWLKNNVRASGGDPRIFNRKVQFAGP